MLPYELMFVSTLFFNVVVIRFCFYTCLTNFNHACTNIFIDVCLFTKQYLWCDKLPIVGI